MRLADAEPSRDAVPSIRVLARHAAWNYAALVVQLGGSFALIALAFRQLSAHDVGAFALASVTVGLVQILDPAAGYVMSRMVAEHDGGGSDEGEALARIRAGLITVAVGLVAAITLALVLLRILGGPGLERATVTMIACVVLAACVQLVTASTAATALGLGDFRRLFEASALTSGVALALAWTLLPPLSVGALGVAVLGGQIAGRGWLLLRGRRGRRTVSLPPSPLGPAAARELWRHSGAVYLSSLAAQVLVVSDLWTVGAINGTATSAAYRAGSLVPTQASALFYRIYDVLYPRLPRLRDAHEQQRIVTLATRVFCAGAGALFTALFLERGPLTRLIIGAESPLAERVFGVFCAIWLVNVPVHGLALLLIARGHGRAMTPVVLIEAVVNVALSAGLVLAFGPLGAAVGTLATMTISNLIVLPHVVEKLVPGARRLAWTGVGCCVLGVAIGALLQAPLTLALQGVAGSAVLCLTGAASMLAGGWLAAGRDGRQVLRTHG
jgi:O-antigen/teichoic acid export membrane protein